MTGWGMISPVWAVAVMQLRRSDWGGGGFVGGEVV